ncbi:MAG: glycosyltransferase family 2 protein [bacterium]|nr:glycosyltransferase family 2 protein [bacterium]
MDSLILFLSNKSYFELFSLFWYFIIFDFSRYILTDLFFLIHTTFTKTGENKQKKKARYMLFQEYPLVSILVPGKNEGKHLHSLVESIQKQTYSNTELIIIDDGSDDDTAIIGRDLERMKKVNLFLSNKTRGGKASAANLGLRFAKGKYIVHLDADSHLSNNSIENIVMPFYISDKIGAVAGDIRVNNVNESISTTMQGFEYIKNISLSRIINSKLGILRIVSGAFGAFRMDLLKRTGGWDIGPGLDGDITVKFRKLKKKIWFEPSSVCYTNVPNSFRKLAKQRYRWSRSLIRFRLRKHLDVFNVMSKNFSFINCISFIENVFFNFILNIKWWTYVVFIFLFEFDDVKLIILLNYFIYFLTNLTQYFICYFMLGKTLSIKDKLLVLYTPLVPLYTGIFLRTIHTYAYLMEILFKMSYEDKWNPWKVSQKAKEDHF